MRRIALSFVLTPCFAALVFHGGAGAEEIKRPPDADYYDGARAEAAPSKGNAGVKLYEYGQTLEQLSRSGNEIRENSKAITLMTKELIKDETIRGFGSMGGEEFFSYLNTSDSLHRIAMMAPDPALRAAPKDWSQEPSGDTVTKGLKWLVSVQGGDGGWGQDGGEASYARPGVRLESTGNDVANTAVSTLALLRAGHTPVRGEYKDAVKKALDFILARVEESKDEGLQLATPPNTQIQRKLGPFIDTFMASMLLAEVDGNMGDEKANARVRNALNRVIAKIEKNQNKDGTWNAAGGWAPLLGTSYCSRSLDVAQKKGVAVRSETLNSVNTWTVNNANVALADSAKSAEYSTGFKSGPTTPVALSVAVTPPVTKPYPEAKSFPDAKPLPAALEKPLPSEEKSLVESWNKWNAKIKTHITGLQNEDGTWSGQHCITGRVACTGAAVLTLLAERTAVDAKAAK